MALETILRQKKEDLLGRTSTRPLSSFRSSLGPSQRSLPQALAQPHTGFILECKRSSPSRGRIRKGFDPAAIATTYAPFADAISVLTDARFFDGDPEYLRVVSDAAELPVLCKDFVLDPYQVYEARMYGADAILLMLSVLDDRAYRACADAARGLEMDVLTEVHDRPELERAIDLDAEIIGINNRDLKTLEVDLRTTEALASAVPDDRIVVSESGISTHRDVLEHRERVDAFLVGSALMERADLATAVRELVFGPVKVCGLTSPDDARLAFEHGAAYGGLIFAEKSPRCVGVRDAIQIADAAPLRFVGVFVDAPVKTVAGCARELGLAAVQLHGDEGDDYIDALRRELPAETAVWQVRHVRENTLESTESKADSTLLDTFDPDRRGGTGRSFDWSMLEHEPDIILSGGLNPSNARRADEIGARLLDVNSGVESEPGVKDPHKLQAFFQALRGGRHD
jgi:indole-3-glycerol phosphate synthase/phosphoribosylanthranilate isomerase